MPGIKITGRAQLKNELGRFSEEVENACDRAAYHVARRGASLARGNYAATGLGWTITFGAQGGGGDWQIVAVGQWAEAAEFGIPAHVIAPHGDYSLANAEDDFGPIMPPGASVKWKPKKAIPHHVVERAGDDISNEFEGVLIAYLP